jgi:hypothetical protein
MIKLEAALGALLIVSVAGPASAQSWAERSMGFSQRLVVAHNAARTQARVTPVAWDPALAAGAAGYARQLAASGRFEHSDRRARPGIGENLWIGTQGAFSYEQMVGNWVSERRWFVPGTFPRVSRTGNWEQVGHYSQIVWPTTTRVGCGLASARGRDVLVCRYSPAGNVDGRSVG